MVNFLAGKTDLHGFSAADRIVGKAAALLFVLAKVKEVYSEVMSKSAAAVFDKHGISYSCGVLTDRIINRKGDDICPMEKLTMNIDDPALAYSAISKKLSELMADRNSADKKL